MTLMTRIPLSLLAVAAGALLPIPTAVAAKGDPQKAHTPADMAKARSIAIRRADLPAGTWKAEKSSSDDSSLRCPGFEPDMSDLVETGTADSPDFTNEQTGAYISSTAGIFKSTA